MWEYSLRVTVGCVWVGNILYWVFWGPVRENGWERDEGAKGKVQNKIERRWIRFCIPSVFWREGSIHLTRDHLTRPWKRNKMGKKNKKKIMGFLSAFDSTSDYNFSLPLRLRVWIYVWKFVKKCDHSMKKINVTMMNTFYFIWNQSV